MSASDALRRLGLGADTPVQPLGEGQFCAAMLVGPDVVVRFPKHATGVESLSAERRLVAALEGRFGATLPEPLEAQLDLPIGQAFAAHRLVPGEVVTQAMISGFDERERAELVRQLRVLLSDLAAAAERALGAGVAQRPLPEIASALAADVDERLADRLSAAQLERAHTELANLAQLGDGARALCHTDLGGNLVWDAVRSGLGVIDFGGAVVSDPVVDLASLSALDEGVSRSVAERSARHVGRHADVGVVRSTFVLQDALNEARQQRWSTVDEILRRY